LDNKDHAAAPAVHHVRNRDAQQPAERHLQEIPSRIRMRHQHAVVTAPTEDAQLQAAARLAAAQTVPLAAVKQPIKQELGRVACPRIFIDNKQKIIKSLWKDAKYEV
jgi:hypothetical protein